MVVAAAEKDHWNKYMAIFLLPLKPFIAKLPLPMNEFNLPFDASPSAKP